MVSYSSSDTRDVAVGKSDLLGEVMQSICHVDGQIPARSQSLTEKRFATYHRPGGRRWVIRSQQGYIKGSLYSFSHSFSANSSALWALKQKTGIEVGPLLDSRRVAGPSAAVLISALIHRDL